MAAGQTGFFFKAEENKKRNCYGNIQPKIGAYFSNSSD